MIRSYVSLKVSRQGNDPTSIQLDHAVPSVSGKGKKVVQNTSDFCKENAACNGHRLIVECQGSIERECWLAPVSSLLNLKCFSSGDVTKPLVRSKFRSQSSSVLQPVLLGLSHIEIRRVRLHVRAQHFCQPQQLLFQNWFKSLASSRQIKPSAHQPFPVVSG